MTIKIAFGIAYVGWLPVEVVAEGREFGFLVSYTPDDFLSELIGALSGTLTCDGTYVATIHEGPVQSDWNFHRASDTVAFCMLTDTGRNAQSRSRTLLGQSGQPSAIVLPFWRGLRELASRQEAQQFEAQWRRPFPSVELDKLTAHVRQLKS